MRKVLLGTTAIVAVGLLASGVAYAQDEEAAPAEEPMAEEAMGDDMMADDEMMAEDDEMMAEEEMMEEAPAAEGISVGVGGYYNAAIGFADVDEANLHSPSIGQDIEIVISGETTLDNGLTVGVSANIEGNKGGDALDERKIYFQGPFGELQIGSTESAPQQMGIVSARASTLFGVSTPFYIFATPSGIYSSNDGLNEEDNAKIIFFTPSFNGVKLGASFAPSNTEEGQYGGNAANGGDYSDQLGLAVSYSGDFGDSSFSAMVGYETYEFDGMCDGSAMSSALTMVPGTFLTKSYTVAQKLAILQEAFQGEDTNVDGPYLRNDDDEVDGLTELEMYVDKAREVWNGEDDENPLIDITTVGEEGTPEVVALPTGLAPDEVHDFNTDERGPSTTSGGSAPNCEPSALRVGASFSAGGVTVAGTMLEIDRANDRSQSILDLGLSFDTGAATIGLGWATSSTEAAGGGDDEISRYGIDFSMPLGTGISLDAQVDTGENTPAGAQGTEWTQFMLGTHIGF
jgi:predicted porin